MQQLIDNFLQNVQEYHRTEEGYDFIETLLDTHNANLATLRADGTLSALATIMRQYITALSTKAPEQEWDPFAPDTFKLQRYLRFEDLFQFISSYEVASIVYTYIHEGGWQLVGMWYGIITNLERDAHEGKANAAALLQTTTLHEFAENVYPYTHDEDPDEDTDY